jgi:hypothetical protein
VSADLSPREELGEIAPGESGTLRVEAIFRDADARHADTIAAEMIDRAHELANLPDCQCDVDVRVEELSADGHVDPVARPAHTHPVAR